jgi:hypothetical protein
MLRKGWPVLGDRPKGQVEAVEVLRLPEDGSAVVEVAIVEVGRDRVVAVDGMKVASAVHIVDWEAELVENTAAAGKVRYIGVEIFRTGPQAA